MSLNEAEWNQMSRKVDEILGITPGRLRVLGHDHRLVILQRKWSQVRHNSSGGGWHLSVLISPRLRADEACGALQEELGPDFQVEITGDAGDCAFIVIFEAIFKRVSPFNRPPIIIRTKRLDDLTPEQRRHLYPESAEEK